MNEAITKLLRPDFGTPGHLTTGQGGLTPAQAYGVEIEPSPSLADLEARQSALDAIGRDSLEGVQSLASLVMSVEPDKLAEAVAQVAASFATRQLLERESAAAHQSLMTKRLELAKTPEPWNWNRKQLDKQINGSVKKLKDAAAVVGEALLATDTNIPNEVSVAETGRANEAIRALASLSRHLPRDDQRLEDPTQQAMVYAKPTGDLEPGEETREVAVTIRALTRKSVGGLLVALALDLLPGYTLDVAQDWDEVLNRAAILAGAAKKEFDNTEHVYISMGAGGDNVQGGNLPTL